MGLIETYSKFHAFSSSSSQLPADNDLTALSTALHDESQDAVACSPYGKAVEQFVAEGFALCHGGETTVLDFGCVERNGVFWEFEALLDEGSEFANASPLFAEDFLGMCCADDWSFRLSDKSDGRNSRQNEEASIMRTDIGDCGGHSDFNARIAFLGQLALEEFVQLGIEDTVSDELAALGDGTLCSSHGCRFCKFLVLSIVKRTPCKLWDLTTSKLRVAARVFDQI
jgi:hypothetical protein